MGILSGLLDAGGAALGLTPAQASAAAPYSAFLPDHMNLPPAASDPNNLEQVSVAGKKKSGYDNSEELAAIKNVAAKYPTGSVGSGLGLSNMIPDAMPGAGTLRNILGTLGDAFLIQSGHAPIHAQQRYNEQIANAAAGFDTDPSGAAARIAATGAPGSLQDATNMYNTAQTYNLHKDQQEANNTYRQDRMDVAHQNADTTAAYKQEQLEARARAQMGAILSAGANGNGKNAWSTAQAQATALGKKYIKDFNPDLEPGLTGDRSQFNAGYGMTAGQYSRGQIAQQDAQMRDATTRRGQGIAAGTAQARTAATNGAYLQQLTQKEANAANGGPPLTDGEAANLAKFRHTSGGASGHTLNIPGLTPKGGGGAPQASQFQEGKVYQDAHGNKAKYSKGKWIPQ